MPAHLPSVLLVLPAGVRGGIGTVTLTLASGLQRRGADVTVLSLSDGDLVDDVRAAGVRCEVRVMRSKFSVGGMARAARSVRRQRFDVVHTHGPRAMFALNPTARLAGVPAIATTMHGVASVFERELGAWRHRTHDFLERAVARGCTSALIVWAQALLEDVARRGFPRAMLHHIDNPVDTARFARLDAEGLAAARRRFGLAPGQRAIGIVGRLVAIKGQSVLIDAFARVHAQVPDARLLIAGDGPARDALEQRARDHGVAPFISFLGDVRDPEVVMNVCDIVAYPSTHGIIGLTALEAMACGAPVVASRLPGTTEFVTDGQTALLVPPDNSDELARALISLLASPDTAATIGRAGRDMVAARFNPDRFVDQHLALYDRLVHARRQRDRS